MIECLLIRVRGSLLGVLSAWAILCAGGPPGQVAASPPPDSLPPSASDDPMPRPEWICAPGPRGEGRSFRLQSKLKLPAGAQQARVEIIADFADAELWINDRRAGQCEPYHPVAEWDVTPWLKVGENDLALAAQGTGGPAAVAMRISWRDDNGRAHWLVTDSQWQSGTQQAISYGRVGRVLWEGNRKPVPLSRVEDYTQWKRALNLGHVTDPSTFAAPPGFAIQLLHAAAPDEGSWVAMAFDPDGRLTVAREQRGLLRLSLDPLRQQVDRVEVVEDTLQECRGLLYSDGHLYANANNSKALYRLSDTTGDGRFDRKDLLYASEGNVGHGRNDIALGPDGDLYVIHGDAVDLPRGFADLTSPARAHRQGEETREGHLLRMHRDGSRGTVIAAGLRNPFGIAFNRDGEAFTYDADAEYDMGAPWYRPTRVNHLIAGADFGWRGVTGSWPPYYPDHCDNTPSVLDVGRGSPTAVKFGAGDQFPPPYDDALFILDWAYGRVMAVQLEPRGSSYACLGETFLQGRPLNVTDLEFGPDGAMYLITGGRKTQSALYRVHYVGTPPNESDVTPQQRARREHAEDARSRRQTLQKLLGPRDAEALELAWSSLDDADPWLRIVARTVVEHQPLERWAARALQEERPSSAATALLALARRDASRYGERIARKLAELPLESLAPREQMMVLYAGWLCLEAHPEHAAVRAALQTMLAGRYPSTHVAPQWQQQWNAWASRILMRIAPHENVPATVELLRDTGEDQAQQLHYLFVLRTAHDGWSDATRKLYFRRLRDAQYFEGGAGMPEFLAHIRQEALQTLRGDERAVLAELLETDDREVHPAGPPRPRVRRWTLQELEDLLAEDARAGEKTAASGARGKHLYVEAGCAACHRFGDQGRPLGPDLTHVARRFSPRDLLKSIVDPSDVIADEYRNVQIITEDGQAYVGRLLPAADFREPTIRLAADLAHPERVTEIDKQKIVEHRQSSISPMPDGLLDVLTAEEILDLLEYLRSSEPSDRLR